MKDKKKIKKTLAVTLGAAAVFAGAVAGFVAVNAHRNVTEMNRAVDCGLEEVKNVYSIEPVDAGEYSEIKMYGIMKFDVDQYDVKDFGNLSVMKMNMGFMQMASFVLTPYEKDVPMLSMDFIYVLGDRKTYTEYYDLTADKNSPEYSGVLTELKKLDERYFTLEDLKTTPAWYDDLMTVAIHKQATSKEDEKICKLFGDSVGLYMDASKRLEKMPADARTKKLGITQEYCDRLIEKGGVSTDVFKKELGAEKTKDFFDNVFFGTERTVINNDQ